MKKKRFYIENCDENVDKSMHDSFEWCLYIDIEGFKNHFIAQEHKIKYATIQLIEIIYNVIESVPKGNYFWSLNCHQFGSDGFLIHQRALRKNNLNIPIYIAISVMRSFAITGFLCRTQMALGKMICYSGCLPEVIRKKMNNGVVVSDKKHLFVLYEIFGDAIINSYSIKAPKGPLFIVDAFLKEYFLEQDIIFVEKIYVDKCKNENKFLEINWVKYPEIDSLMSKYNGVSVKQSEIEKKISCYLENYKKDLTQEWIFNSENLIKN